MYSSAAVRDLYQQILHPDMADETLVSLSRYATMGLGLVALAIAMAVAIVPGPARMGTARGETATLSWASRAAEVASWAWCARDDSPWSIVYPIPKTRIPPAMRKAGSVMPKRLKIILPATTNTATMPKASSSDP